MATATVAAKPSANGAAPPPSPSSSAGLNGKRAKTPTLLQMEAVECGAAALGIILGHHGRFVPLEELRMECGVSRDGSKANNVLRAARKYGIAAKGFKRETEELKKLAMPVVLFWNFNHFLVLEGFAKGKVFLNDPATGPRVITEQELEDSFTGIVLEMPKAPDFQPGGAKPSLIPGLLRRLGGSETALAYTVLCGLFLVIPGLVIPTFSRIFIDDYLVGGKADIVRPLLIGMAATAVVRMVLTWLQSYYLLRFRNKLALITSSKFFTHILRLPTEFFAQRFGGEIGSRVAINDRIAQVLSGRLTTTLLDGMLLIFYALLMMFYDVPLTLICICLSLTNAIVVRSVGRRRADGSRRLLQEEGKLMGTAMGGLQMIETLKATGGETSFFARWAGYQAKALKAKQELGMFTTYVSAVPPMITAITTAVMLGFGGWRVMDGHLTIGMLVAFQSLMGSFSRPINTFVEFGNTLQELEGDMNRVDDVLRYPVDVQYRRTPEEIAVQEQRFGNVIKLSGHVELRDVTFGYSRLEPPLIEEFNLTIKPGQRVALCGGSGSGKSTVAKLVSGLYRPWKGQVLFDGVPREEIPLPLLTNSIGLVDQDIFLFEGTIRDNLAMWDHTIPETNITRACHDAVIAEIIVARPGGYMSRVEEGGSNFSGGQRQRVEIARALVGNPTFMIFDEATSALDPTTEKLIENHLRRRGCACLIVAHRLSTIRDCDEIIVMQRGRIVQRGTHDEMKAKPGPYQKLMKE